MSNMTESEALFGPEHVKRYQETDGELGYHWRRGTTILLLTTIGRRSGEPRTMPLIYQEDDGRQIVVASKGGWPQHPAWYQNLAANPDVEVQIKGDRFNARARDARDDEYDRLWQKMVAVWPDYENYQRRTERRIPIVVLERAA